jgi:hypothetical protein
MAPAEIDTTEHHIKGRIAQMTTPTVRICDRIP